VTEWQFGVQQVISGLAIGSMYALVALGHVLIWNAMGILNFAHGEMVMLGAFLGLTFHILLLARRVDRRNYRRFDPPVHVLLHVP